MRTALLMTTILAVAASAAHGVALVTDSFETDSTASFALVDDANPDGTRDFQFDYVAAGLPLAPRSSAGDTKGLRLTANDTDKAPNPNVTDAQTLFHNTFVDADQYRLSVDVWINFTALTFSTEHAHVGVGGNGSSVNTIFTPVAGSGSFIGFDGDGGSNSDYRWFRAPANSPTSEAGQNTTLPNDHRSYLGHGSNNTLPTPPNPANTPAPFFGSLFPLGTNPIATRPDVVGAPGNQWTTLQVEVDQVAGRISYVFDNQLTFQGRFAGRLDGLVSLGIADLFTSVNSAATDVYVLFDNLLVETFTAAGGGFGDYNSDGFVNAADYTVWRDALGSTVSPGSVPDGSVNGSVDQADYKVWRSYYDLTPLAAAIPEPSAALLAVMAGFGVVRRGRRS
ncbi:MAG: hypothetical protein ACRCT8_06005 [Lacipirellulaceae bacterium]